MSDRKSKIGSRIRDWFKSQDKKNEPPEPVSLQDRDFDEIPHLAEAERQVREFEARSTVAYGVLTTSEDHTAKTLGTVKERSERSSSDNKRKSSKGEGSKRTRSLSSSFCSSKSSRWVPAASSLCPLERFYHTHVAKYDNRLVQASLHASAKTTKKSATKTEKTKIKDELIRKTSKDNTIGSVASLLSEFNVEVASLEVRSEGHKAEDVCEEKVMNMEDTDGRDTINDGIRTGALTEVTSTPPKPTSEEKNDATYTRKDVKEGDDSNQVQEGTINESPEYVEKNDLSVVRENVENDVCFAERVRRQCLMIKGDTPSDHQSEMEESVQQVLLEFSDKSNQVGPSPKNSLADCNYPKTNNEDSTLVESVSDQVESNEGTQTSESTDSDDVNHKIYVDMSKANIKVNQKRTDFGVHGKYTQVIVINDKSRKTTPLSKQENAGNAKTSSHVPDEPNFCATKLPASMPLNICGENIYINIGSETMQITSFKNNRDFDAHVGKEQRNLNQESLSLESNVESLQDDGEKQSESVASDGNLSTKEASEKEIDTSIKQEGQESTAETSQEKDEATRDSFLANMPEGSFLYVDKHDFLENFQHLMDGELIGHQQNIKTQEITEKEAGESSGIAIGDKIEKNITLSGNENCDCSSCRSTEIKHKDTEVNDQMTADAANNVLGDEIAEAKDSYENTGSSKYPSTLSSFRWSSSERCVFFDVSNPESTSRSDEDVELPQEKLTPNETSQANVSPLSVSGFIPNRLVLETNCSIEVEETAQELLSSEETKEMVVNVSSGFGEPASTDDSNKEGSTSEVTCTFVDSKDNQEKVSDICGDVDVYLLKSIYNSKKRKLKREIAKYRDRTQIIERLRQYIEHIDRETSHMRNLVEGTDTEITALKIEASDLRGALLAICDSSALTEIEAKKLEPACYRRYLNIRSSNDATNVLTAIRSRMKALKDLEVLTSRRQLILNHILPKDVQEKPPQEPKPASKTTKTAVRGTKSTKKEPTSLPGKVVIEVVTPLLVGTSTPSWSEEPTSSEIQSTTSSALFTVTTDDAFPLRFPESNV